MAANVPAIDVILSISKDLFDLGENSPPPRKNRREAVATDLDKIATALSDSVAIIKRGEKPTALAAQLEAYVDKLPDTIGDYVDADEADAMSFRLSGSFGSGFTNLAAAPQETLLKTIESLEGAVGYFKATADSIRASK